MPAISIIVPVYKTAEYLAECLDSVLAQTFADFEVICVDDGSPDNAGEILEDYRKRDQRIKVLQKKNEGLIAARNDGIRLAKGKYIFPLDSDDKIMPTCLAELYKTITTTDYAVVGCEVEMFGEKTGKFFLPEISKLNAYSLHNPLTNSVLWKKKYWEKYGGYDPLFAGGLEDLDFLLNFFDDGQKLLRLPQTLFFYRQKLESSSRNLTATRTKSKKLKALLKKKHKRIYFYRLVYNFKKFFPKLANPV